MIYKVELKTSKYKKILTTPLTMYMYKLDEMSTLYWLGTGTKL
jgi:hypothetical protein